MYLKYFGNLSVRIFFTCSIVFIIQQKSIRNTSNFQFKVIFGYELISVNFLKNNYSIFLTSDLYNILKMAVFDQSILVLKEILKSTILPIKRNNFRKEFSYVLLLQTWKLFSIKIYALILIWCVDFYTKNEKNFWNWIVLYHYLQLVQYDIYNCQVVILVWYKSSAIYTYEKIGGFRLLGNTKKQRGIQLTYLIRYENLLRKFRRMCGCDIDIVVMSMTRKLYLYVLVLSNQFHRSSIFTLGSP